MAEAGNTGTTAVLEAPESEGEKKKPSKKVFEQAGKDELTGYFNLLIRLHVLEEKGKLSEEEERELKILIERIKTVRKDVASNFRTSKRQAPVNDYPV